MFSFLGNKYVQTASLNGSKREHISDSTRTMHVFLRPVLKRRHKNILVSHYSFLNGKTSRAADSSNYKVLLIDTGLFRF